MRQNLAIYDGLFPHFATRVGKRGKHFAKYNMNRNRLIYETDYINRV